MSEIDQLAIDLLDCRRCSSPAGVRCVTRSGRVSRYVHDDRSRPLWEAYWRGMTRGGRDQQEAIERAVEKVGRFL